VDYLSFTIINNQSNINKKINKFNIRAEALWKYGRNFDLLEVSLKETFQVINITCNNSNKY